MPKKIEPTEEQVVKCRELVLTGLSRDKIGAALGFSYSLWKRIRMRDPRIRDAMSGFPEAGSLTRGPKRKEILPEHIPKIEKWAREGFTNIQIARKLQMPYDIWKAKLKEHPEIHESLLLGRAGEEKDLVDVLKIHAKEGRVAAPIFLLKARHGYSDQPQPMQDNRSVTIINLNQPMPEDEYRAKYKTVS